MTVAADPVLPFHLPDELAAGEPPEARGFARDQVRLMVSRVNDDVITHARFSDLPDFLDPGDLLVVNASATINASFHALREAEGGPSTDVLLHLSTPLMGARWSVELRRRSENGSSPLLDAEAGERMRLPAGGTALLVEPYVTGLAPPPGRVRLWVAELSLPGGVLTYAARYGSPVRYSYVPRPWPLPYYQTVFSRLPGSTEMPSAARAFTPGMLARLAAMGVRTAPLVLHTGVSSLDADEPPYPERFRVPEATAEAVNRTHARGGRIVGVGTTTVRALETVASGRGRVRPGRGWTDVVISPERGIRAVDAVLTGLHGPNASHLSMLEAFTGPAHLSRAYEVALQHRYLWHEFGDLHLILP